jgi:acetylornithine deacetylase
VKTVVEHLSHLIRISSVSSLSNRPMVDYAWSELHSFGWQTLTLEYTDAAGVTKLNMIAAPGGQRAEDPEIDLAFVCHTDTVPFAADWSRALDPFVADGGLYGCGACDVKGFLACLLTAAGISEGSQLRSGLRLILTADEEVGCVGISHLLASGLIRPRRAVVGEPTSLHCARAGKGYCLAEITVLGQQAHSAHPEQGASAI